MERITALRRYLETDQLDAALISSYENWRYFSGFSGSHAYLLITAAGQILITDPRYSEQAELQAQGWQVITHGLDPMPVLKSSLENSGAEVVGYESEKISDFEIRKLRDTLPGIEWKPMRDYGKQLRAVKDDVELSDLRQAIRIADQALEEWAGYLRPGMTERQAAVELEYRLGRLGSEGPAFGTIIAAGERSALPHAAPSDRTINPGEMLVVDCGAIYHGYHSDITRTIWIGEPDPLMQEIYSVVQASQDAAMGAIRPGISCGEVDEAHRQVFREHGLEEYSLRGLGHGVGLEIHERPRVVMDSREILFPGMVFTIEPGLYIPKKGGVRIEDIVHVTDSGCEVLTQCPRRLQIEAGPAVEDNK